MVRTVFSVLLLCLGLAVTAQAATPLNRVAAVVNGAAITEFDLQNAMRSELVRAGLNPKNPAHQEQIRLLERRVLENMISDIILAQEAERMKVTATDADVESELAQMKGRAKLSEPDFERQLAAQGLSLPELRARLRNNILKSRLLSTMVGRKVVVTKEEVEAYYYAHQDQFSGARNVRFALLVYPPSESADTWAARIKSGKADFDKVTRQISEGPRKEEGGDLGEMAWEDVAPGLRELLVRMKPGDVSPVLDLGGRKGQVKLLAMTAGTSTQLDADAYAQAERMVREPRLEERYREYIEQLRKRAVVDIRN